MKYILIFVFVSYGGMAQSSDTWLSEEILIQLQEIRNLGILQTSVKFKVCYSL